MGLADALFAGLGTGLNNAAQNYQEGLRQQQQMAQTTQQMAFQKQQMDEGANNYAQQQAGLAMVGNQNAGLAAHLAGNDALAAQYVNQVPALYQKANNIQGVPLPAPVVGSPASVTFGGSSGDPTAPEPGKGLSNYTTQTSATPGLPNDFSNPQTQAALQSSAMLSPQRLDARYGEKIGVRNPWTGDSSIVADNEHTYNPIQRVPGGYITQDADGNPTFTRTQAQPTPQPKMVQYQDPADGIVKWGSFGPGGTFTPSNVQAPKQPGATAPKFDKNWNGYSAVNQYDSIIQSEAANNHLDPALLKAVIWQESRGNKGATSPVGAQGLMQLMPDTAKGLGVTNPYDAAQNIAGGAKFLAQLSTKYGGDVDKILAAYNAGPGAVDKAGGIPPFKETQAYVPAVKGFMQRFQDTPAPPKAAKKSLMDSLGAGANGKPDDAALNQLILNALKPPGQPQSGPPVAVQ